MDIRSKIESVLLSMKQDSALLPEEPNDLQLRELIAKYNTIFTGEKFNKVLSIEVASFLQIPNTDFNNEIGTVANNLGMHLEELHAMDSKDPSSTDAYYITLY